jgi:hypothetical protein
LQHAPEPVPIRARVLHDVSTLALIVLIVVPFYMLLNQYWKSVALLAAVYGVLALAFVRLGRYMRRVMRWLPAEIPPWRPAPMRPGAVPQFDFHFGTAEAIRSVYTDPHYLEDVLKPRLRQLLAYRVSGLLDMPFEGLDAPQLAHVAPAVVDFLQRREATGLWARYRYRRQRVHNVLAVLRAFEAL